MRIAVIVTNGWDSIIAEKLWKVEGAIVLIFFSYRITCCTLMRRYSRVRFLVARVEGSDIWNVFDADLK
ncbi:hypothetical protein L1278_000229 [Pontibacter sp. HSC-36F09]|nr:hypothetical protein [Pontibacter sp. HSC-36F09]